MNTNRPDRICTLFLRGLLVAVLCLIGLLPLCLTLLTWFGWAAAEVPKPVSLSGILSGFAFLILTIAWYAGIGWLIRFFIKKKHRENVP